MSDSDYVQGLYEGRKEILDELSKEIELDLKSDLLEELDKKFKDGFEFAMKRIQLKLKKLKLEDEIGTYS